MSHATKMKNEVAKMIAPKMSVENVCQLNNDSEIVVQIVGLLSSRGILGNLIRDFLHPSINWRIKCQRIIKNHNNLHTSGIFYFDTVLELEVGC